ncbi:MAG: NAD(P)H-binding protein [Bacteroidetes bacterium]|nr:NAD(P)H-binding protein [Bacteroidota bacterium]
MEQKKIAIIGGTDKAGKYLVEQLLRKECHFKLLLRNPDSLKVSSPLIDIIAGDARNYKSVLALTKDCHAVISMLGQPKGERTIFSDATKNVLRAMNENNIQRYILITGLNVDTPHDNKNPQVKFATEWMKTNYPETTADKQIEYDLLVESNVNWTLIRLPLIEQTETVSKINISLEDCPGDKISATNLALFIIEQLSSDKFYKKSPFIANV